MIQLILDTEEYNITLPESQKGGYTAVKEPLSEDLQMISGRLIRELRGNVWKISYQYGYFSDEEKSNLIAACEKGRKGPIYCGFLPPDSDEELTYSYFFITDFTYPKFMWSRQVYDSAEGGYAATPLWGDFSLTLREVEPSD